MKVMCAFGTRPEAIKMAPVINALRDDPGVDLFVCVTAQHRRMLDQVLDIFSVTPDADLDVMRPNQDLYDITSSVLTGMRGILDEQKPDWVLVHGDTTTTMAVSLAAFYQKIPVGHVEAGLRTRNIYSPWPEEVNRRVAGTIASKHFAPTPWAGSNLLTEGVNPDTVFVTGNTVVDALLQVQARIEADAGLRSSLDAGLPPTRPGKRRILVTGHRRENFGAGFRQICEALRTLAQRGDVEIVYPVHLNPNVQAPVREILAGIEDVRLIEPLEYLSFVRLMMSSQLVITDSGGIQEEAPSLGLPVLVMRDTTERPEAVDAGAVKLVGADAGRIVGEANRLLDDTDAYAAMAKARNPYGDGKAASRIVKALGDGLCRSEQFQ
jgi:UDP-N-acetylglucosamine 2-epimerase (non-hydrolysing)